MTLGRLDFVYWPSRDAAADLAHWTERLGAEPVFAIEERSRPDRGDSLRGRRDF